MNLEKIKDGIVSILSNDVTDRNKHLNAICQLLYDSIDYYDWVGFYFADTKNKMLHLGPYVGTKTEHTEIPFGKGICGQVALSNENFIVQDVGAQDNYIACSTEVKSEIVIPIFVNDKNIGQIDIDSHRKNAFGTKDEVLLEFVVSEVAKLFH